MLDVILRKTYGWHKKEDKISLSQFRKATGLKSVHLIRARNKLLEMNIITVTQKGNEDTPTYRLQKNYKKWKPLPKKVTLPKKVIAVTQKGNRSLPKKVHTKETITKKTTTKETTTYEKREPNQIDIKLTQLLIEKIQDNDVRSSVIKNLTEKKKAEWINECRRLREIDKRDPEEIRAVILFSQKDDFWKTNILSMPKLTKKFDQLYLKAKTGKTRTRNVITAYERATGRSPHERR